MKKEFKFKIGDIVVYLGYFNYSTPKEQEVEAKRKGKKAIIMEAYLSPPKFPTSSDNEHSKEGYTIYFLDENVPKELKWCVARSEELLFQFHDDSYYEFKKKEFDSFVSRQLEKPFKSQHPNKRRSHHSSKLDYPEDIPMIRPKSPTKGNGRKAYYLTGPWKNFSISEWRDVAPNIFGFAPSSSMLNALQYGDMLNEIHGNLFRTKEGAEKATKRIHDSISKLYEKHQDWAKIVREIEKEKKEHHYDECNPYINDAKRLLMYSKFFKKDKFVYYKFTQISSLNRGSKFALFKITVIRRTGQGPTFIGDIKEIAEDYAIGNFFLSKNEALNSMMFRKYSTFFKFVGDKEKKISISF